jgi:hypothetical protein
MLQVAQVTVYSEINTKHINTVWAERTVSFTPGRITPGKEPRKELIRRLGGPQSRSGDFRDEKNLFLMPAFELRTFQPVAESLYQLRSHHLLYQCIMQDFDVLDDYI